MPNRKTSKKTPKCIDGVLYLPNGDGTFNQLRIGTHEFAVWACEGITFSYQTKLGVCTVCPQQTRGHYYWYAAKKNRAGKLMRFYVGNPEAVTADKLNAALVRFKEGGEVDGGNPPQAGKEE